MSVPVVVLHVTY